MILKDSSKYGILTTTTKSSLKWKKKEDNFHIIFDRGREPKRLFLVFI